MKKRQVSISLLAELDGEDLTNVANALIELEILLKGTRFKPSYLNSFFDTSYTLNPPPPVEEK